VEKFEALCGRSDESRNSFGTTGNANISRIYRQVKESVKSGAKVLTGGEPLSDRLGNFYPPTILTDIHLAAQIKKNFWSGGAFRSRDMSMQQLS